MEINNELENELDDEEQLQRAALATLVVLGAEEARLARLDRRHRTRYYLCRPELMPDPRIDTAWQHLYNSFEDRAYITTMGFDVDTFHYILDSGFEEKWNSTPIPRHDADPNGTPRLGGRSLDAAGALGLYLHYVNSTMRETSLQQIFALIPVTVNRYISFAQDILRDVLRHISDAAIAWPSHEDQFDKFATLIQARHSLLLKAFGSIDGVKLPIETSADEEIENASYNGWLHEHFTNCVLVFSPEGLIISCVLNAPGSWHDSRVARPIYEKLRNQTPDGFFLIADTAFPRGTNQIAGRIQAPLKSGDAIPDDPAERNACLAFNRQLLSYRQTAEWGMRGLQGSFGRLRLPLKVNDDSGRSDLLEICCRLSNLRAIQVGVNQIRNVYMPLWKRTEDSRLWEGFEQMLFSDIRRGDRVARFHLVQT